MKTIKIVIYYGNGVVFDSISGFNSLLLIIFKM